ncbi:methyl-accepting chemotaxis protein [Ureibacillus manganicus]|uniref:Chemotaxis protein n=1 Tax=Ureibacillus manganicus DSM 26584 TaxID=1384049 RepID=A0A0A3I2Z0_9BACL|nr:methyl-accepting chemotaxis protein [Ureibacillus manganicus]KGR77850.1 chemotaxis protein [Ureibacillus manganicus DSM 26584]
MLSALFSKKDDIELFKQKIDELNEKLDEKEHKFQIFLNQLHKELISTIEQHDKVNSQHIILGEMVKDILNQFNIVEQSTVESNVISDKALEKGDKLINASEEMVRVSNDSKEAVSAVGEIIDRLGEESKKTTDNMNELSVRSKQIEDIVKVISDISNQTNLLALNASIEAARAGEHGKGFSVVADEVRKLAESTKKSTEDIVNLTKETQLQIMKVFDNTQSNMQLVEQGMKTSVNTSEQIHELLSMIKDVKIEVHELITFIQNQKISNEEVLNNFKRSTEIFDETNSVLNSHIQESDIVTEKLIEAVEKVKQFPTRAN